MANTGTQRSLAALAILRLSEKDIRSFHEFVNEMSSTAFLETIRDLEDEIENSTSLILERNREQSFIGSEIAHFYADIDKVRKTELNLSVHEFADALSASMTKTIGSDGSDIPPFDSRRGLQAWLKRLVRRFSEADVYHSAMRIRHERRNEPGSDWKLK